MNALKDGKIKCWGIGYLVQKSESLTTQQQYLKQFTLPSRCCRVSAVLTCLFQDIHVKLQKSEAPLVEMCQIKVQMTVVFIFQLFIEVNTHSSNSMYRLTAGRSLVNLSVIVSAVEKLVQPKVDVVRKIKHIFRTK